jgi:hypothetical protein
VAEIAALQEAAPGEVPGPLALHLASCARCQRKALFGDAPRRNGRKATLPDPPTIRRTLVLALLALAVIAAFFWSLRHLIGQVR